MHQPGIGPLPLVVKAQSPNHWTTSEFTCAYSMGFPVGSAVKNLPASAGAEGLIPGLGLSNGNAPQDSCLENPMDRAAWWVAVHGVTKELDTT